MFTLKLRYLRSVTIWLFRETRVNKISFVNCIESKVTCLQVKLTKMMS